MAFSINPFHSILVDVDLIDSTSDLEHRNVYGLLGILGDEVHYRRLSTAKIGNIPYLDVTQTKNPQHAESFKSISIWTGEEEVFGPIGENYLGQIEHGSRGHKYKERLIVRDRTVLFSDNESALLVFDHLDELTPTSALLILAACGVHIYLPQFGIDYRRVDAFEKLKEKLQDERNEYLAEIMLLGLNAAKRIKSKDYKDIIEWGRSFALEKIWPKKVKFEAAVRKQNKKLLRSTSYTPILRRVPTIVGKLLVGDYYGALAQASRIATKQTIESITGTARNNPEPHILIAYQIALQNELDSAHK